MSVKRKVTVPEGSSGKPQYCGWRALRSWRRCPKYLNVCPIAITEMKISPTIAMAITILLPSSSAGMISNSSRSIVLDSKRKRSRTKIASCESWTM